MFVLFFFFLLCFSLLVRPHWLRLVEPVFMWPVDPWCLHDTVAAGSFSQNSAFRRKKTYTAFVFLQLGQRKKNFNLYLSFFVISLCAESHKHLKKLSGNSLKSWHAFHPPVVPLVKVGATAKFCASVTVCVWLCVCVYFVTSKDTLMLVWAGTRFKWMAGELWGWRGRKGEGC